MPLIPLSEARSLVLAACPRLPAVSMPVLQAVGFVLAEDAMARVAVPPFPNSAMDGYAVRAADVALPPAALQVVGRLLAGSAEKLGMGRGQAVRIMTGAPVPAGADAVCMIERTRTEGDRVVIESSVSPGENIRETGDDIGTGSTVAGAGTLIGPTQLAALISAGCGEVRVFPRPRVGVVSTGDELVDTGQSLGEGQIYDSNRPMVAALAREAGCSVVDLGHAPDDEEAITAIIDEALGDIDALVLSGGVSVGDVDLVRVVLEKLGGGSGRSLTIAIRPAKPFAFAQLDRRVPAFGLPGNPVSAAVSFELLVRPALLAMAGHRRVDRPVVAARAMVPMRRKQDGKIHFVRVALGRDDGGWTIRPASGQGSHQIGSMARADGLAVLPDGEGAEEGDAVKVMVVNQDRLGEELLSW